MTLGIVRLLVFTVDTVAWIPAVLVASLFDRDARAAFCVAQYWAWFNLKLCGVRLTVDGLDHLDPRRSYVFMSNHRSNVDVLALVVALWDFQLRWVAKEELFHIPLFGWALRAMKQIVVNRGDHAQALASLATAKQRMHDGISVVFFPEGTRGEGTMLPFKKGGFVFALETGIPVVPIGISGTASILPRAGWLVRRGGDVQVSIRPPIPTAGRTLDDRDALLAETRAAIGASIAATRRRRRARRPQAPGFPRHTACARPRPGEPRGRRDRGGGVAMSDADETLRIVPLGGLGEIGLNMLLVEYGDSAIAIDCGVMFPEPSMLGIDLVMPDVSLPARPPGAAARRSC